MRAVATPIVVNTTPTPDDRSINTDVTFFFAAIGPCVPARRR